jgi:PAS domain S-box-containing protein
MMDHAPQRLSTDDEATQRQRQLTIAVEQADESIVITDANGNITYINPAFERKTGYQRDEVLGRNPGILKSGAHNHRFYENMWHQLTLGRTWRGRFINKRKDGTLYHEEASISPVMGNTGHPVSYVAVKRDVTRETDLERQFHEAQRMETVGHLAGGVAHDFNNLLSVILGCLELLQEELTQKTDPSPKYLEMAQQAARRASQLTGQLLAFSRRQFLVERVLEVNAVVQETEAMLHRVLRENIHIVTRLGGNLGSVKADSGRLQQCILNLAVNARDAMPEGGTLTIETADVVLTDAYRSRHDVVQPGRYVVLSVADNGTGMNADVQSRIFEPFYTTKPKGQGTGLGLAMVYGTVKQSGGYIWVYSELGKGTIFKIYLPVTGQLLTFPEPAILSHNKIQGGLTGDVLLVEDDPNVSKIAHAFLEDTGLTILDATSAESALQLAERHGDGLRLLVTDLMLPGKDGVSLASALMSRFPGLKVIIISGYTEHGLPSPGSLEGAAFLSKPFSRAELIERVEFLLGRSPENSVNTGVTQ